MQTFSRTSDHLRLLTFTTDDGRQQTIKTTDEHPFWSETSRDYTASGKLQVGEQVRSSGGSLLTLTATSREEHPQGVAVYNLEVEGLHNYFVAPTGSRAPPVLAHNADCTPKLTYNGPPSRTVRHHIFNKFRGNSPSSQKYRDFFKMHGINVDSYSVVIPESLHKGWIHKAGQNWTTKWKRWIDANPNATTKEVYHQAGRMMEGFGINHLPIIPY